jgi:hypothetical protein
MGTLHKFSAPKLLGFDIGPVPNKTATFVYLVRQLANRPIDGLTEDTATIHPWGRGQMFTHFSRALHELLAARFRGFPDI